MNQLNAISDLKVFTEITDACLDQITGHMPSKNLTDTLKSLNLCQQDYIGIVDELKSITREIVCSSKYDEEVLSEIDNDDKRTYILDSLKKRKSEFVDMILDDHNSSHTNLLYNYDWKVKMILGTSSNNNLKYPVLQLDTTLLQQDNGKASYNNKSFELCKKELDQLINVLERSQNSEKDYCE